MKKIFVLFISIFFLITGSCVRNDNKVVLLSPPELSPTDPLPLDNSNDERVNQPVIVYVEKDKNDAVVYFVPCNTCSLDNIDKLNGLKCRREIYALNEKRKIYKKNLPIGHIKGYQLSNVLMQEQ